MVATYPYQDYIPYSSQKNVSKWLGTFNASRIFYRPLKSILPSFAGKVKKFIFEKFLVSKLIKSNLTLRGLLERIDKINNEEARSILPVLENSLKMAHDIEIKSETLKNHAPMLFIEAQEMASLLEELYTEVDFIINPDSYDDSLKMTEKAFQQLKAVEAGLLDSKSLESILT